MATAVEVEILNVCGFPVEAFNFEAERVYLALVVFELVGHLAQLLGALLKVLLVDSKLLSHLWTALFGQNVLQLHIQLLLFLNKYVLLLYFLSLSDESLLQRLNFLDHFVCVRFRALKFAPSVHIHGLLELLGENLSLLLLL